MRCPKCGVENPNSAKVCNSCNRVLISTSQKASNPDTKTSGLAIVSFVLGILSFFLGIFSGIPAIILGIISLLKISQSAGQLKGKGFGIAGIAIPVVWIPLSLISAFYMRGQALDIKQKTQFANISVALELFWNEFDGFPTSDALDSTGRSYCGAMKLCESMMGQDLKGFHPNSIFRNNGTDGRRRVLYPDANNLTTELYRANIKIRRGPYLKIENSNAYRLKDLFWDVGSFNRNNYVLCDAFMRVTNLSTDKKIGMPILYYKADTSKNAHDINDPDNPDNIYNYKDNHELLALGVPGQPDKKHPLYEDPTIFYIMTQNDKVTSQSKPYRADSFILISAGKDGLYGTADDICNFEWKYRE